MGEGENSKKKESGRKNFFLKKLPIFWSKFFTDGRAVKKYARYYSLPARTQTARRREREERERRERREREREVLLFSERKMSATPSALKASPQEVNAEEENVLASRDDDDDEEGEEQEEQERGASVGKEEEQEECVVFFFSRYLFLNGDDDDDDD